MLLIFTGRVWDISLGRTKRLKFEPGSVHMGIFSPRNLFLEDVRVDKIYTYNEPIGDPGQIPLSKRITHATWSPTVDRRFVDWA